MRSRIYEWFVLSFIGNITWGGLKRFFTGVEFEITYKERLEITKLLIQNNCLCLTRRKTHLTTYLIAIAEYFLRGKWGYWSHALFNFEGHADTMYQLRFIEAIGRGVVENDSVEVLNCDSMVLLVPQLYGKDPILTKAWDECVQSSPKDLGKKYDTRLNIKDPTCVSCVEEILDQIKEIPDYEHHFSGLLALIEKEKNLTPDMLYDCNDFRVLLEIRH